MFKLQTRAGVFKESFYLFQAVDTIIVDISQDGFEFSTIDPGRTMVVHAKIPKEIFDTYEFENGQITWNFSSIRECFRYTHPNEVITLEWNKEDNILRFQSKLVEQKIRMEVRNYSPPIQLSSLEKISYSSKFVIDFIGLEKIASICGMFSRKITLSATSNQISIDSFPYYPRNSQPKNVKLTEFIEFRCKSGISLSFGQYFNLVIQSLTANNIEFHLENEQPLKIVNQNPNSGAIITYYFAPIHEDYNNRY